MKKKFNANLAITIGTALIGAVIEIILQVREDKMIEKMVKEAVANLANP